jgi:hypothetical protein
MAAQSGRKTVDSLTKGHPSGTVLGRLSNGDGATEYLSISDLATEIGRSGTAKGGGGGGGGLPNSGVTAGTYTNTTLTVNAQGVITAASSGGGGYLPLVTGETPGPTLIANGNGECIGVPQ